MAVEQQTPAPPSWDPKVTIRDGTILIDDVAISFQRTIRVPDNGQVSKLPPSLGTFPISHVKDHTSGLSQIMAAKGGAFLPMYRMLLSLYPTLLQVTKQIKSGKPCG